MIGPTALSAGFGLLLQLSAASDAATEGRSALTVQEERQAVRWRFTMPYYDQKKQTFICRTTTTSGDGKSDRFFCRAMVACYNRHRAEHNRMMRVSHDAAETDTAARDFRQKRNLCFRNEVAAERASGAPAQ